MSERIECNGVCVWIYMTFPYWLIFIEPKFSIVTESKYLFVFCTNRVICLSHNIRTLSQQIYQYVHIGIFVIDLMSQFFKNVDWQILINVWLGERTPLRVFVFTSRPSAHLQIVWPHNRYGLIQTVRVLLIFRTNEWTELWPASTWLIIAIKCARHSNTLIVCVDFLLVRNFTNKCVE